MIPGADDLETPPKLSRSDEGHLSSQGDGATVLVILTPWKPWRNRNRRVCLKIGYIPNYSHLIGIMIINHWV